MNVIAILPGLLALYWIYRHSHREAYLDVYLFSLFLLPGWCRFVAPALPDPTFHEAAILPIAAAFFWKRTERWRFSVMDGLALAFAAVLGFSEYQNAGFAEAQNLMFDVVAACLLPYVLAKGLIEPGGLRVAFARRVVWLLAVLALAFLWEFKFAYNPFRLVFDRFFPGQGTGWVTTFRHGFARAAGPYGHAILAGIVFLIGFSLARWLERSGLWEARFRRLHFGSWSKARLLTVALLAGLLMTMVRGPMVGAVIAAVVCAIGAGADPRRRAKWVASAVLLVGIPAGVAAYSYASVGRAAAKDASQESAAYRKELIDKYVSIALDHSALGWGRNGWPKVAGMPSIDNYFLLLALMHGVPATILLGLILLGTAYRALRNGMRAGPASPPGSSLSFTLAGIYCGLAFSFLTVYMGDNVIPIFFTLTGFADGYLSAGGDLQLQAPVPVAAAKRQRFEVVFA